MFCSASLAASITAAAVAIEKQLGDDELQLLAAVFSQLGDTLATLAAARAVCRNQNKPCGSE